MESLAKAESNSLAELVERAIKASAPFLTVKTTRHHSDPQRAREPKSWYLL
ncbi:hypothetical protein ACEUZ9_000779 [Paracoccus litorisediminis]|uniref:hypothetical protein n=1 Tax=Paracoccus litorisediminis TaxID=2006130 RepID=UPI00373119F7